MKLDRSKTDILTEQQLCGALLLDPDMVGRVAHLVNPEDFTHPECGRMYGVITGLWRDGLTVDVPLVAQQMPDDERGLVYEYVEGTGTSLNAPRFADAVKDAANRRRVALECTKGINASVNDAGSVTGLIGSIQDKLSRVVAEDDGLSIEAAVLELQRDSEEAAKDPDGVPGVATGYKVLDKVIGGMNGGDLIVIAARPSVGKTSIGVNILDNINLDFANEVCDTATMLFSAEMTTKQVLLRMIARESMISLGELRRGNLTPAQWVSYTEAAEKVSRRVSSSMFIDDKPRPTLGYISGMVRSRKHSANVKVVMIDYLQIMGVDGRHESRVIELNSITAGAKEMAKALDVAVILVSQIGRKSEEGAAMRRPVLSELKGSGSIEEDADAVVMVHREYRDSPMAEIIIGKNRNGETGSFKLAYDGPTCTFKEIK